MAWVSNYTNKIVAGTAGVRGVLRDIRDQGAAKATALHAAHDKPGGTKITKSRGTIDFFWSMEDGDGGKGEPAALAIEIGDMDQDGLHIISRSARAL